MINSNDTPHTVGTKGHVRLGEMLVSMGLLDIKKLDEALNEQRTKGGRLGEVLIRLKILSEEQVHNALAEQFSTEYVHLEISEIKREISRLIPEIIAKRFQLLAIG
jgi:type IV pilus assembly protein PilB